MKNLQGCSFDFSCSDRDATYKEKRAKWSQAGSSQKTSTAIVKDNASSSSSYGDPEKWLGPENNWDAIEQRSSTIARPKVTKGHKGGAQNSPGEVTKQLRGHGEESKGERTGNRHTGRRRWLDQSPKKEQRRWEETSCKRNWASESNSKEEEGLRRCTDCEESRCKKLCVQKGPSVLCTESQAQRKENSLLQKVPWWSTSPQRRHREDRMYSRGMEVNGGIPGDEDVGEDGFRRPNKPNSPLHGLLKKWLWVDSLYYRGKQSMVSEDAKRGGVQRMGERRKNGEGEGITGTKEMLLDIPGETSPGQEGGIPDDNNRNKQDKQAERKLQNHRGVCNDGDRQCQSHFYSSRQRTAASPGGENRATEGGLWKSNNCQQSCKKTPGPDGDGKKGGSSHGTSRGKRFDKGGRRKPRSGDREKGQQTDLAKGQKGTESPNGRAKSRGPKTEVLKFLQLNCHHSKVAMALLTKKMGQEKSIIALITEPWHGRQKKVTGLPNGDRYYEESGRAAIVCQNVKSWPVPELTNKDMVTVNIVLENGKRAMVSSVYWDILNEEIPRGLSKLAKIREVPVIIGMDSNAHSVIWGSNETNRRGETMESFLLEHDLKILNEGNKPTFEGGMGSSIIDITIGNSRGEQIIQDWKVEEEDFGSDHNAISFQISRKEEKVMNRGLKKADWETFRNSIESEITKFSVPNRWSEKLINEEAESLQNIILSSLDQVAPEEEKKKKSQRLTWWSKKLGGLRKQMNQLRQGNNRETYKETKRAFKKELTFQKRESWKKWTSGIQNHPEIKRFMNAAQGKGVKKLGSIRKPDGGYSETLYEATDILLQEHFPGSTEVPLIQEEHTTATTTTLGNDWITGKLVQKAIESFGDNKAPGVDGIKPIVLKQLPSVMLHRLSLLYRAILTIGSTPETWKRAKVVFIPKPGKSDYTEKRSWRPISLTSFLLKTLERMVAWHLEVIKKDTVGNNQHAFQRGKSTETALLTATKEIEKTIKNKQMTLGVFLDISGAFDNVSLKQARISMENHGIPQDIIKWYDKYLHSRSCEAEGQIRYLTKGTPQGGVLSPKIWNFVFDGLLKLFQTGPIKAIGFADDCALLITGIDLSSMVSLMNSAIKKATEWGLKCGLSFSCNKTQAILFTNRRVKKEKEKFKVRMNNVIIDYTNKVTYLGLSLDSQLRWTDHVKSKIRSAKKLLFSVRNCIGKIWGPKPKIMMWIYEGIVRPCLTYGAVCWEKAVKLKTVKTELAKFQRLALTCCAQVKRSTPGSIMEIMLGIKPLHLHIKELAEIACLRISGVGNDSIRPTITLEQNFEVNIEDGKDVDTKFRIYTDGSKIEGNIGSGVVAFKAADKILDECHRHPPGCTVFQAEVYAIWRACELILSWPDSEHQSITILSDSQAAILAIQSHLINSEVVLKARETLNYAGENRQIQIKWIKAHNGHFGNEEADKKAKQGAMNGIQSCLAIARATSKEKIGRDIEKKWQEEWEGSEIKGAKKILKVDRRWGEMCRRMNKGELGRLIRAISGHNYLRGGLWQAQGQQKRSETMQESLCRKCNEDKETSDHLLRECPVFSYSRWVTFGEFFLKDTIGYDPKVIWGFFKLQNFDKWEQEGVGLVL